MPPNTQKGWITGRQVVSVTFNWHFLWNHENNLSLLCSNLKHLGWCAPRFLYVTSILYLWIKIKSLIDTLIFWAIMPCELVGRHQHFKGTCCLHLQGLRTEIRMKMAVFWCVTLCNFVDSDQTTWCYISGDRHHENLKSHQSHARC